MGEGEGAPLLGVVFGVMVPGPPVLLVEVGVWKYPGAPPFPPPPPLIPEEEEWWEGGT